MKSLNLQVAQDPPKKACCTPGKQQVHMAGSTAARGQASEGQAAGQPAPGIDMIQVPTAEPIDFADTASTDDMVQLPGGRYLAGTDVEEEMWVEDGEGPVREVNVDGFYIDRYAVTNAQFRQFVQATGYETDAERFGWSFVFHTLLPKKFAEKLRQTNAVQGLTWWIAVPGACWYRPEGERSSTKEREDHPVVHVSWNDAIAYCQWAGKRLAREAEWEYAARGGLEQKLYPWGDQLTPRGKFRCNTWQGKFPDEDTAEDGFAGTCPVDAFKPNGFDLYNVSGNVWEWCNDWFSPNWHVDDQGNARPEALDNPRGADNGTHKMQKGGSFLCHKSYCNRYRLAARTGNTPDSSTSNNGFRCVRDL